MTSGLGGGTFHSRHLGELEGFQEGTPEHARLFGDSLGQVERHLHPQFLRAGEDGTDGIDRLKEIVPVWKKEVSSQGEAWVEGEYLPKPGE